MYDTSTVTIKNMSQNDSKHTCWEFTSLGSSIRIWPCQPLCLSQGAAVANNLASMRVSKSSWRNIQGSSQKLHFRSLADPSKNSEFAYVFTLTATLWDEFIHHLISSYGSWRAALSPSRMLFSILSNSRLPHNCSSVARRLCG